MLRKIKTVSAGFIIGILSLNIGGSYDVQAGKLEAEQLPVLDFPIELVGMVYSHLSPKKLELVSKTTRKSYAAARTVDRDRYRQKLKRAEKLLGDFILLPIPQVGSIAASAYPQELWVEVMHNNPSDFKKKKYCPKTHKEVEVFKEDGSTRKVEMCSDFPVDRVNANDREKDSDGEFINKLNRIYEILELDTRYRRATVEEYEWADTEGGRAPKLNNDDLWRYATYLEISDEDPTQHPGQSPLLFSKEIQPHGVNSKEANTFGFRRSGLWEWTDNMLGGDRVLVGGGWGSSRDYAVSGFRFGYCPNTRSTGVGPARLVRTP